MNNDYEAFCMADPRFYDAPGVGSASEHYGMTGRAAPDGWNRQTDDHWAIYSPDDADLPTQGWKVHVSSCLDNAERIITVVWDYAVPRKLAFKFLASPRIALSRNAKYAGRGGSGKLVTAYPADEAELELVCKELDEALAGEHGPYILSDLRWGDGPVHVRYGGFSPRYCHDDRGENVLAIEDPSGTLVPDVRGPVFALPSWVQLPEFLQPHLQARNAVTTTDLPYSIDEALHFSNGGGVYAGVDSRSGERIVLKEARPHAGISGDGADAVTRLRRERDTLERLAGIDAVPELRDYLSVGEHEFLVMEHIEGQPLNQALVQRHPLLASSVDPTAVEDYALWALGVQDGVARAIGEIHDRGVVYGDLHMFNVLLRPDGRAALIDFEVASPVGSGRRPGLGAVGFAAPRDRRGTEIDDYAVACLQLALFVPLEQLMSLDRGKAPELAAVVAEQFPVPRERLDRAVAVILGPEPAATDRAATGAAVTDVAAAEPAAAEPAAAEQQDTSLSRPRLGADDDAWRRVRASLSQAILASATPERDDRLFPGDIAQFRSGGLNLAYGAAGVLYVLDVTGAGRHPDHEEWLIRKALDPGQGTRLGFYDGLHGVAFVLAHLGHADEARKVLDICLDENWEASSHDLQAGLAGMGLNLVHLAGVLDDASLLDTAWRATNLVANGLGDVDSVPETSGGRNPYAGLMRGSSGRALLFVRMFERTGDAALLDLATTALRQDLRRCVRRSEDGQLQVDEGWRTMPYLATGSAGIGLVLERYLAHRHADDLADAHQAIGGAARSVFYAQAGLFNGRAGMVLYLSDGRRGRPPGQPPDADLAAQVERLDWHALTYEGHLAFPGEQLLRLSMDLATGSAGVLLALGAALHYSPVHLPFLGPAAPAHERSRMGPGGT